MKSLSESLADSMKAQGNNTLVIKPAPEPMTMVPPTPATPTPIRNGELFVMMGIYVNKKDLDNSNIQYHNPLNKTGQDLLRAAQDKRERKRNQKIARGH